MLGLYPDPRPAPASEIKCPLSGELSFLPVPSMASHFQLQQKNVYNDCQKPLNRKHIGMAHSLEEQCFPFTISCIPLEFSISYREPSQ
jgi:hypothetical protein